VLLTNQDKTVGARLIQWDRGRVSQHVANGFDCTIYSARIDLAEACLQIDTDAWPNEVRFLFMAILEVIRTAAKARAAGIGAEGYPVPRLSRAERDALRQFAKDIDVIDRLREVAPIAWSDVDTEGP
jgi:hypothetical protein